MKPEKKTRNKLTVEMDEEALPLLTPQAEARIRVRHLWFFLVAGLLVIVLAYCLFINNISNTEQELAFKLSKEAILMTRDSAKLNRNSTA